MKVYKVELLIVDSEVQSEEEITSLIENQKFPNWSLNPSVMDITGVEIGEWYDEHPLNYGNKKKEEYDRLFNNQKEPFDQLISDKLETYQRIHNEIINK